MVEKLISFLILYLFLFSIYSYFFTQNNTYMFWRHTVIVYSIFAYFVGYYLSKNFKTITKISNVSSSLLLSNLMTNFLFFRASALITIPVMFLNSFYSKNMLHLGIIISLIFIVIFYEESTQLACLIGFLYIILIPNFRMFLFFSFLLAILLTYIFIDIFSQINDITYYYSLHTAFSGSFYAIDGNLLTRFLLWYQLLIEHFPNNIFGIGLGSPIYDVNKIPLDPYPIRPWTLDTYNMIISKTYLIGGHNSFFYIFTRTGIIPFAIIIGVYYLIIKHYYDLKKQLIENKRIIFFYAFLFISISASLNVVLESPIHASLYWILMGAVTHSIIETQKREI